MTEEEIRKGAESFGPWYHEIELFPGYKTVSDMAKFTPPVWDNIREVRKRIDYRGKSVIDIGAMTGMFAFEAEKLGASPVFAVDIFQSIGHTNLYNQFLFARSVLNSRVTYLPYGDVHRLDELLRGLMDPLGMGDGFDIVQGLGLLYHNECPLLALQQMRRISKIGGTLLLETVIFDNVSTQPVMLFNDSQNIYCDKTTFWAPNLPCLIAMLKMTGWSPDISHLKGHVTPENATFPRVCLAATAI